MEKQYCVYMHKNKINGKVYVGQTKYGYDPNIRYGDKGHGYRGNKSLYPDIIKYGWDNFEHIVLKNNLTKEEADYFESYYINKYKSNNDMFGYNITNGGTKYTFTTKNKEKLYGKQQIENKEYKYSKTRRKNIGIGVSKVQIGLVWLHKDKTEIQVKPEQIQYYIEQGYTKGRFFDKIWIHNDTKTKMIHKHELQKYLDNGWTRGRSSK